LIVIGLIVEGQMLDIKYFPHRGYTRSFYLPYQAIRLSVMCHGFMGVTVIIWLHNRRTLNA